MTDILHRVIADTENIFGLACVTTTLVNEACQRHQTGPTAAAALGRALTATALLAALLKDDQWLQVKLEGSGPLAKIICEAGHEGWVRGYVANPTAEVPLRDGLVDVPAGLGRAGFLTVTKDIGLKRKYQGMVQLYTSEIGEDIAYYLLESEQTPSVVGVSVHLEPDGTVAAAGGFLLQTLPPVKEETLSLLESRVSELPSLASLLQAGEPPETLLARLFTSIPHHATGSQELYYRCSCSKEKMERAVFSLGHEELGYLLASGDEVEVQCEFCRSSYRFSHHDLQQLQSLTAGPQ